MAVGKRLNTPAVGGQNMVKDLGQRNGLSRTAVQGEGTTRERLVVRVRTNYVVVEVPCGCIVCRGDSAPTRSAMEGEQEGELPRESLSDLRLLTVGMKKAIDQLKGWCEGTGFCIRVQYVRCLRGRCTSAATCSILYRVSFCGSCCKYFVSLRQCS